MKRAAQRLRAAEFAKKAGVTVRTLHHYDRIGLLKPAGLSDSGYRLYGEHELIQLERIAALKFIGLPLGAIKELISHDAADLAETLRAQRHSIEVMRGRLDEIVHAIASAETSARAAGGLRWESLKNIIELMEKHDTMEWMKSYYTEEQLADLRARGTPEVVAQGEQDWKDLLAEVETSLHEDPASEHAQSLAARWSQLIGRFTGGDPGIAANLQRLYADKANWPADFKQPFSDEARDFIARATAARENPGRG